MGNRGDLSNEQWKRLARKSRCFSRRIQALARNLHLFVYCYNQRQIMKHLYP